MSVSRAACAVWCRGSASSSSAEPVIANGRTSLSDSARASARSAAWFAACRFTELTMGGARRAGAPQRALCTRGPVPVPLRNIVQRAQGRPTDRLPRGRSPARAITYLAGADPLVIEAPRGARGLSPVPLRGVLAWRAASRSPGSPRAACGPSSRRCQVFGRGELLEVLAWRWPRPACSIPAVWCSSSLISGPVSVCRACSVRRSHRSPSSNSPRNAIVPASVISAGAITGSVPPAVPFGERNGLADSAAGSRRMHCSSAWQRYGR